LKKIVLLLIVLEWLLLSSCAQKTVDSSTPFKPDASIQEIMVSIIDPNIDYVWNSVATIHTKAGMEERRPKTDEDWKLVRQHALTVSEATNLLLVEGRAVARNNASTSSAPAELSASEIQATINSNRAGFVGRVDALHKAVAQAIVAIDAKNADELERAGGIIDQACEGCHVQFWYPNDKRPL
jgi:hypothetical protein